MFELPGLSDRLEDIEPNLDFELTRFAREQGQQVRFNLEARRKFLAFACSGEAKWNGNFRELTASVTRMATLGESGRIQETQVQEEILRLRRAWENPTHAPSPSLDDGKPLDLFDHCQLKTVIEVCQTSTSLSEAGRKLFAVSRTQKRQANDADRLRKYLARFDLDWEKVKS